MRNCLEWCFADRARTFTIELGIAPMELGFRRYNQIFRR
jgi:hypothetical protein